MAAASLQGLEFDVCLAGIAAGLGLSDTEQRLRRLEFIYSLVTLRGEGDPEGSIRASGTRSSTCSTRKHYTRY